MDKRKAYEEKLEAQLEEWSAQLALLKAKADKAKVEARFEYCKIAEGLKCRHHEAREKLQELRSATDETWEEIRAGGEGAWTDIKAAFLGAKLK